MKKVVIILSTIVAIAITITAVYLAANNAQKPEEVLTEYFVYIEQEKYEEVYNLVKLPENYSKDDFIARNKNIYEGIEANNVEIEITAVEKDKGIVTVSYKNKMNIRGGNLEFENKAKISKDEDKQYKIEWSSNLIFPELNNDYKVRVNTLEAERGSLLDRNGKTLAGQGKVSSVGIVPR